MYFSNVKNHISENFSVLLFVIYQNTREFVLFIGLFYNKKTLAEDTMNNKIVVSSVFLCL